MFILKMVCTCCRQKRGEGKFFQGRNKSKTTIHNNSIMLRPNSQPLFKLVSSRTIIWIWHDILILFIWISAMTYINVILHYIHVVSSKLFTLQHVLNHGRAWWQWSASRRLSVGTIFQGSKAGQCSNSPFVNSGCDLKPTLPLPLDESLPQRGMLW